MTIWISLGVALLAFVFGVTGLYLQKLLPAPHTSDRSRDMITAVVGLISLLLALVLGTLIGSAYSFYATQKTEMNAFAARALQLDIALAEFGPETAPARAMMKNTLMTVRKMLWWGTEPGGMPPDLTVAAPLKALRNTDVYVASLDPKTPAQHQFQTAAAADASCDGADQVAYLAAAGESGLLSAFGDCRFLGADPVLRIWVLSRINPTTVAALGFGAFAVGSAVFLILELTQPFTGVFRLPSGAFDQMLAVLGQ